MKKTIRLMAMLAVGAALLTTACGKDDPTTNPTPDDPTPVNPVDPDPDPVDPTAGWVDLGLPSGLLWAECNLGAAKPEEYGDYYAWGETAPKEVYTWSTYKYCTVDAEGTLATLTKYNTSSDYGTVDNQTTLHAPDDAATAKLGNGARTPTRQEWEELIANTTSEWTTMNGVNGRKFTASNGKSLFLPAAGCRRGSELSFAERGYYWLSSLQTSAPERANDAYFYPGDELGEGRFNRCVGMPVRPVRSAF